MTEAARARLERAVSRLWYGAPSAGMRVAAALLSPLSWLAGRIAANRARRIDRRPDASRPAVVVVGNLVAGGAGKTPVVIALAQELSRRGWRVGLLAGGYRAAGVHARRIRPDDDAHCVGDEPLLLARRTGLPVAVGRRRAEALALLHDCELVVSDDGLQHTALPRDVEIAVFDARGAGNGRLLPAGPLRDPLPVLDRMDALVMNDAAPPCTPTVPTFTVTPAITTFVDATGRETPAQVLAERARGKRVTAVAGIASPERFFAMLDGLLDAPVERVALPDHARIEPAWLASLPGDFVLTTEKDAVKSGLPDGRCLAARLTLCLPPELVDLVERRLAAAGRRLPVPPA